MENETRTVPWWGKFSTGSSGHAFWTTFRKSPKIKCCDAQKDQEAVQKRLYQTHQDFAFSAKLLVRNQGFNSWVWSRNRLICELFSRCLIFVLIQVEGKLSGSIGYNQDLSKESINLSAWKRWRRLNSQDCWICFTPACLQISLSFGFLTRAAEDDPWK